MVPSFFGPSTAHFSGRVLHGSLTLPQPLAMHFSFSTKASLYTGKKREDAVVDTVDVLELPRLLCREQSWTLKVSRALSSSYCSFAARCSSLISLISCVGGTSGKEPDCQCRRHKETWVQSLGGEDPLEEGMASHSSILTWKTPWTRNLVGYSP